MPCRVTLLIGLTYFVLLPPATKLWQGNAFTPVCHSVHRRVSALGVCQTPPSLGPEADTPPVNRMTDRCKSITPWADTPRQTTPGQTPPVHAGIHTPCPVHAGIHTPLAQCMLGYGQQAGGTHPTGMHSCF